MREEDLEIAIKVVIVGNGAVGKSSMIQRYCKGTFTKDYKKTIGVDFLERQIECDGEDVRLMLWDTAGQEEFDAITKAYYRGAQACVLAFSTTDRDSFDAAHSWKMKVEDECGEIPTVLVQNKIDLLDQSVVNPEEADLLARALGCRLLRTSVKEDINVNAVFRHLAARCLAELRDQEDEYMLGNNGIHPLTISAFGPPSPNHKHHSNGTIVLRSSKLKGRKKRNVFKNACRIL
ncbi:ras-related protein Rab-23-like [Macrosteles quadrilineatus]|uniref:ras-related protein Rab-23-like n=1 Tax=Macrosteles quadrilineatus TaxID=74068 RepID=UPI0023E3155B|nr:ras-related protein Rab-23-like [Macrosteles quadrilineatus]XP_054290040.1 ras-related protein Rab-23-like [Macrosteles quadrilineatus]